MAVISQRTAGMKQALCDFIRSAGLVLGFIRPQIFCFPTDVQSGSPFPLMEGHAKYAARFVVMPSPVLILRINGWGCFAQILDSVVGSASVDVVKGAGRMPMVCIEPRGAVGGISMPINADHAIPVIVNAPGNHADAYTAGCWHHPNKLSCISVVIKKLAQALRGKIVSSHDAVYSLIGQRPVAIHSRLPASPF